MSTRSLHLFALFAAAYLIPVSAQEVKNQGQNNQVLVLSVTDMKRQMVSCKPHKISRGLLPKGTVVPISVSIDENGKLVGIGPAERCPVGCGLVAEPIISIRDTCQFAPLKVDGRAVPYKGNVELVAP